MTFNPSLHLAVAIVAAIAVAIVAWYAPVLYCVVYAAIVAGTLNGRTAVSPKKWR